MQNWFQSTVHFFKEAYAELKKVTWLSRKEVIASTIVVIILVTIIAGFVGFVDFVLSWILGVLL